MRLLDVYVLLRSLRKTAAVAVFWGLAASTTFAASAPETARESRRCDGQRAEGSSIARRLPRHPKSYGGPLASLTRSPRHGPRFDLSAHVRRAKTSPGNDAAAIQNDAPAARVDAEDGPVAALRPLGFLVGAVDSHPRTRAFSPRSPRGPPPAV
jgi:hypothetical protein